MVESFSDNVRDAILLQNGKIVDPSELYQEPSVNNPFANVMMITTRTRTKPAASSLDENVNKTIVDKTKTHRQVKPDPA
jgi:hypothetical protein